MKEVSLSVTFRVYLTEANWVILHVVGIVGGRFLEKETIVLIKEDSAICSHCFLFQIVFIPGQKLSCA